MNNPATPTRENGSKWAALLDPERGIRSLSDDEITQAILEGAAQDADSLEKHLPVLVENLRREKGLQSCLNILKRVEVSLHYRRPRLGIYDNAFHFIGGAQKYGCTIAAALQNEWDITLIANAEISVDRLMEWYDLDLSQCRVKMIPIPFFARHYAGKEIFDAGLVDLKQDNPFHVISLESGDYDVFVNNCMLEMVYPLSSVSEFVCHFPEREISRFFHVDRYTHIIHNSRYTAEWIEKRWNLKPHVHIYPPVDMESDAPFEDKEDMILSVSRFELSGNKQQLEMLQAFAALLREYPDDMQGWRLVLAGGSTPSNPYLDRIHRLAASLPKGRIEICINSSAGKLRDIYRKARLFWHFSGLHQIDPARIEHFGMTTVEAMQNGAVPLVFDGGGQKEIVEEEVTGLLFKDEAELAAKTLRVIRDRELALRLSGQAVETGRLFSKAVFTKKVRDHFSTVLAEYQFMGAAD